MLRKTENLICSMESESQQLQFLTHQTMIQGPKGRIQATGYIGHDDFQNTAESTSYCQPTSAAKQEIRKTSS
jgi:hypothetical protein